MTRKLYAAEISLGFNSVNERKSWSARPNSRSASGEETVHFTAPSNLVALVYECSTGRFAVRFNKFQATWGDYCRSIARSLHVVLSTLEQAGLPFRAPETDEGIEIICTVTDTAVTYVRWEPPLDPIMPEVVAAALTLAHLPRIGLGEQGVPLRTSPVLVENVTQSMSLEDHQAWLSGAFSEEVVEREAEHVEDILDGDVPAEPAEPDECENPDTTP